jgi:hypothetical protein
MKNDLTTGAWQHDIGCPISIVSFSTSDVCRAIVEAVATDKIHPNGSRAVVAVKTNLTRTTVLEPSLRPRDKDVASCKDCLGGYDGFNCILAVETKLPMSRAIQQSQGKVTLSSAGTVKF